jgi:hypothetical protein
MSQVSSLKPGSKIQIGGRHISNYYPGKMYAPDSQLVLSRGQLFALTEGDLVIQWEVPVQPFLQVWEGLGTAHRVQQTPRPIKSWLSGDSVLNLGSVKVPYSSLTGDGIFLKDLKRFCFTLHVPE